MLEYYTICRLYSRCFFVTFFYRGDYNDDAEFSGLRWEHTIVGYLSMPTYDSALQHAKSIFYPGPLSFLILMPPMILYRRDRSQSFKKLSPAEPQVSISGVLKRLSWRAGLFSHRVSNALQLRGGHSQTNQTPWTIIKPTHQPIETSPARGRIWCNFETTNASTE